MPSPSNAAGPAIRQVGTGATCRSQGGRALWALPLTPQYYLVLRDPFATKHACRGFSRHKVYGRWAQKACRDELACCTFKRDFKGLLKCS